MKEISYQGRVIPHSWAMLFAFTYSKFNPETQSYSRTHSPGLGSKLVTNPINKRNNAVHNLRRTSKLASSTPSHYRTKPKIPSKLTERDRDPQQDSKLTERHTICNGSETRKTLIAMDAPKF